jgi:hypothetical protein
MDMAASAAVAAAVAAAVVVVSAAMAAAVVGAVAAVAAAVAAVSRSSGVCGYVCLAQLVYSSLLYWPVVTAAVEHMQTAARQRTDLCSLELIAV